MRCESCLCARFASLFFKLKVQLFLRIENVDKILQTICYQQKKRKRFVLSLLLCTLTVVEDTFARE